MGRGAIVLLLLYLDDELEDKKPLVVSGLKILLSEQSVKVNRL